MDESVLAEIIKKTVEATSGSNGPDYTVLTSVILLVFGVFALLTKYMGSQIIKHQDDIRKEEKKALIKIKDEVGQHGIDLVKHGERIGVAEKNITKLWDEKAPKKA